jgi:hypothetical protein
MGMRGAASLGGRRGQRSWSLDSARSAAIDATDGRAAAVAARALRAEVDVA